MTSYDQGQSPAPYAGHSQSAAGADRQGEQNFVLVDEEQGLEIGDEGFIPTEVRRVERAGNRQSGEPHSEGANAGAGRQGDSR